MSNFFSPAVKEDLIDLKSGLENLLSKINSVLEQSEVLEERDEEQTPKEQTPKEQTPKELEQMVIPETPEIGGKKHKKKTGKRKGKKGGKKTRRRTK